MLHRSFHRHGGLPGLRDFIIHFREEWYWGWPWAWTGCRAQKTIIQPQAIIYYFQITIIYVFVY